MSRENDVHNLACLNVDYGALQCNIVAFVFE